MKMVRNILGIFALACISVLPMQAASAESVVVDGGNVTVQAQVLRTHYILIDEQGHITQIASNTTEEAKPRVFFLKEVHGNERAMTEDVYQQYKAILPTGKSDKVGIVYQRSELERIPLFATSKPKNDNDLLSFLRQ